MVREAIRKRLGKVSCDDAAIRSLGWGLHRVAAGVIVAWVEYGVCAVDAARVGNRVVRALRLRCLALAADE